MARRPLDYFSKTLEKGMRILSLFDEEHPHWSQRQVAARVEINPTSTYRFINTFVQMGYLTKDSKTKAISLGPMAVAMGQRLVRGYDLGRIIAPLIDEAHRKYNVSVDVALFVANSMAIIDRREAQGTLTFRREVSTEDLYCTGLGKALLANLAADELQEVLKRQTFERRTEHTRTSPEALQADLAAVRERGYSVNNEEYIRGLISIGAPLFDPNTKRVVGALSFDSTTVEQPLAEFVDSHSAPICDLARRVSALMPAA